MSNAIADKANKILESSNILILYHGSRRVIEKPIYGKGKSNNDYGSGFYLTENEELAKEWAALYGSKDSCYLNRYEIDTTCLKILHLKSEDVIEWASILYKHRGDEIKPGVYKEYADWLLSNVRSDLGSYDCIIGARADDSYFQFIAAFITNSITDSQLLKMLKAGDLGGQFTLMYKKAFDTIRFGCSEEVNYDKYIKLAKRRDRIARNMFSTISSDYNLSRNGKTIREYMR